MLVIYVVDLCIGNKSDENESNSNESNENESNGNELSNVNESNESEISNLNESCGNGDSEGAPVGTHINASEADLEEIPMEGDSGPRKRALSVSSDSGEIDRSAFVKPQPPAPGTKGSKKVTVSSSGWEILLLLEAAVSVVVLLQLGARTLVRAGSSGSVLALRGLL